MAAALLLVVSLPAAGCGSGSDSNSISSSTPRPGAPPEPPGKRSPGVGMSAPVSKVIVARRTGRRHGLVLGLQTSGASGCPDLKGRPEIGLYTDVPVPDC